MYLTMYVHYNNNNNHMINFDPYTMLEVTTYLSTYNVIMAV